ncbi:tyrosine-type recombinase/integrase [Pseudomonas juntendi]|uniref:tyrosine-type recombinase/integrase n=1 Tax=Pseudomonas TaxID=286 RepID=UPI00244A806D|nr:MULTISPECIES: tyrosine-type recombinase/integrase [Pseudomonas]MDG9873768.1 tyrosine-type recombinase/integrase [Pseudomonas juntendi]MDQ2484110.1 tyrosine-type recombinase/integrase [Pseudomonas putida]
MASLTYIHYIPTDIQVKNGVIERIPLKSSSPSTILPQIIWGNCEPWREANLWAHQRAQAGTNVKTIASQMGSLCHYATWLEAEAVDWWHFPVKKQDRCLILFRGSLIRSRDAGILAASTATKIMRNVIAFYRWLRAARLFEPECSMWTEKNLKIVIANQFGFDRTMLVTTTDLAIRSNTRTSEKLEDGLLPVSIQDRDNILNFAKTHASEELFLLLSLGFYTGMRIGTLCDLKIQTLKNAAPDPLADGLYRLSVGPSASPPVQTKHGVNGQVWITRQHLNLLLEYCHSTRRIIRESKASPHLRDLVFLTRYGNPYLKPDGLPGSAINVEMHALRIKGEAKQEKSLHKFRFHQTRSTYATELARILIPVSGPINALAIVKDALLHKDEATTLKYIRFVEKTPAKIAMANEFTKAFFGSTFFGGERSE